MPPGPKIWPKESKGARVVQRSRAERFRVMHRVRVGWGPHHRRSHTMPSASGRTHSNCRPLADQQGQANYRNVSAPREHAPEVREIGSASAVSHCSSLSASCTDRRKRMVASLGRLERAVGVGGVSRRTPLRGSRPPPRHAGRPGPAHASRSCYVGPGTQRPARSSHPAASAAPRWPQTP